MGIDVERRLADHGLSLPNPWTLPPGVVSAASFVRVHGRRVLVSGHVPLDTRGQVSGPFGKVGSGVTPEDARSAARAAMLGILASLKRELGDLDRIGAWLRLHGMVNGAPGFNAYPAVANGASEVVLAASGPEIGGHARVAIGVAGLPWDVPVEIEAELELGA